MWKSCVLAAALSLAASLAAAAPGECATPAEISGAWQGLFDYTQDEETPATFEVKLRAGSGEAFQGTIVELNTFADVSYGFLLSNVTGRVTGSRVSFTKTYVSSGSVTHSVVYEGVLEPSGRRITGTWRAGTNTGRFEMAR